MKTEEILPLLLDVLCKINSKIDSIYGLECSIIAQHHRQDEALKILVNRSTPTLSCVFCSIGENTDMRSSGRCPRFPDSVARAFQASKIGLCQRCIPVIIASNIRCAAWHTTFSHASIVEWSSRPYRRNAKTNQTEYDCEPCKWPNSITESY